MNTETHGRRRRRRRGRRSLFARLKTWLVRDGADSAENTENTANAETQIRQRRRRRRGAERSTGGNSIIAGIKGLRGSLRISRRVKIGALIILLLVVLVPLGSVAIPFLLYAQPQFGAVLPGGAVLADGGGSNVYILRDGPYHVVLVDCGNDPKMEGVAAQLRKSGLGLNAVEAVLITHAHPDHIAGCAAVPHAILYAMDREAGAIEGGDVIPNPFTTLTSAKPKSTHLYVTRRLSDGETLNGGAINVTAYAAPGHTPGSAAYLIGPVLFVGDAVAFGRTGSVTGGPWIFNTDGDQMAASRKMLAASLAAAHVELVATGHTAPGKLKDME